MIRDFLVWLFCWHKWKVHKELDITFLGGPVTGEQRVMICERCGRMKNVCHFYSAGQHVSDCPD